MSKRLKEIQFRKLDTDELPLLFSILKTSPDGQTTQLSVRPILKHIWIHQF